MNSYLKINFIPVKYGEQEYKPAEFREKLPAALEQQCHREAAINQALLGNAPTACELLTVSVTTAEHNSAAIIKIKALL